MLYQPVLTTHLLDYILLLILNGLPFMVHQEGLENPHMASYEEYNANKKMENFRHIER